MNEDLYENGKENKWECALDTEQLREENDLLRQQIEVLATKREQAEEELRRLAKELEATKRETRELK